MMRDYGKTYKYPVSRRLMTYLGMPVLSLIGLGLAIPLFIVHNLVFGTLFVLAGAWFMLLSAFGYLMCSSITVDDKGIAAHNFGRMLKFISWRDVTKIKKVRARPPTTSSYEDVYYVFDGTFSAFHERLVNLRGPIAFNDKIGGLGELLAKINEAARLYRFTLVAVDEEAARKLAVQKGAGACERTAPKVKEVPLTEL